MTQATPYQRFPNSFKRDLLAHKKLIGCWSSLSSAITTEALGVAGFDWILLDGEHSPNDVSTFIPQLMALKQRGIVHQIAQRRTAHGSNLGKTRWVVERTIAWLHQFRRLRVRYERLPSIYEAFLRLGCPIIC